MKFRQYGKILPKTHAFGKIKKYEIVSLTQRQVLQLPQRLPLREPR